jgi:hypothetical protein
MYKTNSLPICPLRDFFRPLPTPVISLFCRTLDGVVLVRAEEAALPPPLLAYAGSDPAHRNLILENGGVSREDNALLPSQFIDIKFEPHNDKWSSDYQQIATTAHVNGTSRALQFIALPYSSSDSHGSCYSSIGRH